jgi:hypothetical protein
MLKIGMFGIRGRRRSRGRFFSSFYLLALGGGGVK